MESFFPLPKMNLAAALWTLFIGIHALGNKKLSKTSRLYFAAAMFVSAVSMLYERIYNLLPFENHTNTIEFIYMIVLCLSPAIALLLYKACELEYNKVMHVIVALMVVHVGVELALFSGDYIFTVSPEGDFFYGPYGWIYAAFDILSAIVMIAAYIKVGERFAFQKAGYLIASIVFDIMGRVMDYYDATYGAAYLIDAWALTLLYVYYSDLCTESLIRRLESSRRQIVRTLATAIDAKDNYTKGHSYRVARYSMLLAEALGWSKRRVHEIELQGLLHDVGKIGMPDNVLNKASRLNDVEYDMLKAHTRMGGEIIRHTDMVVGAYDAARHHHERYDGKGYPDGLKGKDIPEIARVIAIADAYDAMNSDRIYRKTMDRSEIRKQLESGSGTQFDPDYIRVFLQLFDENKLDLDTTDKEMMIIPSENAMLIKDLLEAFDVKREYMGGWDADYQSIDDLYRYLKKNYTHESYDFEMVVVSISPKNSIMVSDDEWDMAMRTMTAVIETILRPNSVGHQISEHQIVCILAGEDKNDVLESMQNIFLYFYKIFDAVLYDIKYDRIQPEDKENK